MKPKKIMHGNREVLGLIKEWKKEVLKGNINWGAFVGTKIQDGEEDWIGFSYAGNPGALGIGMKGVEFLQMELEHLHKNRVCGPRNPNLDASSHEYNLATDPLNHDFMIYMIDAEMTRIREKAPGPLRIGFSHENSLTPEGRAFWEAVHRPLLTLIGAVEDKAAIGGRRTALFTPSEICLAAKRGEKVPILKAPMMDYIAMEHKLQGQKPPVTITLRESVKWSKRNSNVEDWVRFARDLRAKGENVIFVRDTEKANEPLEDFKTVPQASFYTRIRMALYQQAKINLFVSNGPAGLGLFSDKPYLYFLKVYDRDDEYEANERSWWPKANGIGEGEQWPWALPNQKMIWKLDHYRNLCEAWEQHESTFQAAA